MKEDLTIWHIHGLELPLDIEEADTVEKYEAALAQLEQDVPEDKSAGAAAYIRAYCKAFRTFYDTLFGEGTAEQIFAGIVIIGIIGLLLSIIMRTLEGRLLRWNRSGI